MDKTYNTTYSNAETYSSYRRTPDRYGTPQKFTPMSPPVVSSPASSTASSTASGIHPMVSFVKSELQPYYNRGQLSRDEFVRITKSVTANLMSNSATDSNAWKVDALHQISKQLEATSPRGSPAPSSNNSSGMMGTPRNDPENYASGGGKERDSVGSVHAHPHLPHHLQPHAHTHAHPQPPSHTHVQPPPASTPRHSSSHSPHSTKRGDRDRERSRDRDTHNNADSPPPVPSINRASPTPYTPLHRSTSVSTTASNLSSGVTPKPLRLGSTVTNGSLTGTYGVAGSFDDGKLRTPPSHQTPPVNAPTTTTVGGPAPSPTRSVTTTKNVVTHHRTTITPHRLRSSTPPATTPVIVRADSTTPTPSAGGLGRTTPTNTVASRGTPTVAAQQKPHEHGDLEQMGSIVCRLLKEKRVLEEQLQEANSKQPTERTAVKKDDTNKIEQLQQELKVEQEKRMAAEKQAKEQSVALQEEKTSLQKEFLSCVESVQEAMHKIKQDSSTQSTTSDKSDQHDQLKKQYEMEKQCALKELESKLTIQSAQQEQINLRNLRVELEQAHHREFAQRTEDMEKRIRDAEARHELETKRLKREAEDSETKMKNMSLEAIADLENRHKRALENVEDGQINRVTEVERQYKKQLQDLEDSYRKSVDKETARHSNQLAEWESRFTERTSDLERKHELADERWQRKHSNLENDYNKLQSLYDTLNTKHKKLQNSYNDLEIKYSHDMANYDSKQRQWQMQQSGGVTPAQFELLEVKQNQFMQSLQGHFEDKLQELYEHNCLMLHELQQASNHSIQEQQERMNTEMTAFERDYNLLERKRDDLARKFVESDRTCAALQIEMEALEQYKEDAERRLETLTRSRDDLVRQYSEASKQRDTLQSKNDIHTEEKEQLQIQIDELNQQVTKWRREKEDLYARMLQMVDEKDLPAALESQCEALQMKCDQLERKLQVKEGEALHMYQANDACVDTYDLQHKLVQSVMQRDAKSPVSVSTASVHSPSTPSHPMSPIQAPLQPKGILLSPTSGVATTRSIISNMSPTPRKDRSLCIDKRRMSYLLRNSLLFGRLQDKDIYSIIEGSSTCLITNGEKFVCLGQHVKEMHCIITGTVKKCGKDHRLQPWTAATLSVGEFISEYEFTNGYTSFHDYIALSDLVLLTIPLSTIDMALSLTPLQIVQQRKPSPNSFEWHRYAHTTSSVYHKHGIDKAIQNTELFPHLAFDELAAATFSFSKTKFGQGDLLMKFGQQGDSMFFIKDGCVEVLGRDGKDNVVKVSDFGSASCIGALELLHGHDSVADISAITDVVAVKLAKNDFETCVGNLQEIYLQRAQGNLAYVYYGMNNGDANSQMRRSHSVSAQDMLGSFCNEKEAIKGLSKVTFATKEAVDIVFNVISQFDDISTYTDLALYCWGLLWSLAAITENQWLIIAKNGIDKAISVLKHTQSVSLLLCCIYFLSQMAVNETSHTTFYSGNGLHAILQILLKYGDNAELTGACLECAAKYTRNINNKGVTDILTQYVNSSTIALVNHNKDFAVVTEALKLLTHLTTTFSDLRVLVSSDNNLHTIVECLSQFESDNDVTNNACCLLANLATVVDHKVTICGRGSVECIIQAILDASGKLDFGIATSLQLLDLRAADYLQDLSQVRMWDGHSMFTTVLQHNTLASTPNMHALSPSHQTPSLYSGFDRPDISHHATTSEPTSVYHESEKYTEGLPVHRPSSPSTSSTATPKGIHAYLGYMGLKK